MGISREIVVVVRNWVCVFAIGGVGREKKFATNYTNYTNRDVDKLFVKIRAIRGNKYAWAAKKGLPRITRITRIVTSTNNS